MTGRLLVTALAVVCLVAGGLAVRTDRRCADVVATASNLTANPSPALSRQLADDVIGRCSSPRDAGVVAVVLRGTGDTEEARSIAEGLVRRAPDDYLGWLALARLESDPARRQEALRRARELNPLGTPPAS